MKVEPNRNLQLDAVATVGGQTAEVTISAAEELVDRSTPTLGTTVDERRVTGLPLNGRNILDLALLQPGVTTNAAGTIRSNGSRSVENNYQLDGANNNETATGGPTGAQPRPDAVQEFRLLTSNFEAEFGRNSGSVINVVTRSGGNDFHGNVRAFWRPTVLSAARFFDQNDAADRPRPGTIDDFAAATNVRSLVETSAARSIFPALVKVVSRCSVARIAPSSLWITKVDASLLAAPKPFRPSFRRREARHFYPSLE